MEVTRFSFKTYRSDLVVRKYILKDENDMYHINEVVLKKNKATDVLEVLSSRENIHGAMDKSSLIDWFINFTTGRALIEGCESEKIWMMGHE